MLAHPAAQTVDPAPRGFMTKDYLEAAIDIVKHAGKILREEFERPPHIAYKVDADLVTQSGSGCIGDLEKRLVLCS